MEGSRIWIVGPVWKTVGRFILNRHEGSNPFPSARNNTRIGQLAEPSVSKTEECVGSNPTPSTKRLGEMTESGLRYLPAKEAVADTHPWVRIPLSPPIIESRQMSACCTNFEN